jgi:hypothetical protein
MSEVVASLNAKIAALEGCKGAVQERISAGKSVSQNTAVLQEINESLDSAQTAKASLEDSCCTSLNCNFTYYDE